MPGLKCDFCSGFPRGCPFPPHGPFSDKLPSVLSLYSVSGSQGGPHQVPMVLCSDPQRTVVSHPNSLTMLPHTQTPQGRNILTSSKGLGCFGTLGTCKPSLQCYNHLPLWMGKLQLNKAQVKAPTPGFVSRRHRQGVREPAWGLGQSCSLLKG